ncbi:MAG: DUF58 domain-containing protein [Lachnospiraceae bacterium]|nr:DUF58 domain-containing protein [Lachnospiraceae bacterium]
MLRNRIFVGILWIVSLVGITFYGGTISYGFFTAVTLLPVLSLLYLLCVRLRFSVYQKLEGKSFVSNHAIPYFFTLQDESKFAFAGVRVLFYSDFSTLTDLSDGVEYELLPGTGITRDTTLLCKYRGNYHVGIRTIEITDFLRLFRIRYKNREPLEVFIRPDTIVLDRLTGIRLPRLLARESARPGSVPEATVREYQPGDSLRRVHWKASARENRLLVRRDSSEEQQRVCIFMSTYRESEKPADYLPTENKILEIALALSSFFLRSGIPVSASHRTQSTETVLMDGRNAFDPYYEVCSHLIFSAAYDDVFLFSDLIHRPEAVQGHIAFLVLSVWSASAEKFARILNGNGIAVVVYLVTKHADEAALLARSLPRTEIIPVSPDADLKEVL